MYTITDGNPGDGFAFFGPFRTHDEALEWAEKELGDGQWTIHLMESPVERAVDVEPVSPVSATSEYCVEWAIDVEAGSPEEAVLAARIILTDPTRTENFFEVRRHGEREIVTLRDDLQTGEITRE